MREAQQASCNLQHLYFGVVVIIIIERYYASSDHVPSLANQAAVLSPVVLTQPTELVNPVLLDGHPNASFGVATPPRLNVG